MSKVLNQINPGDNRFMTKPKWFLEKEGQDGPGSLT